MCLVLHADSHWYRAQFHQILTESAQVGLIDFGVQENVNKNNIRKFNPQFDYECISVMCKIRGDKYANMDLLNDALMSNGSRIVAKSIQPFNRDAHEVLLGDEYFFVENEDFFDLN